MENIETIAGASGNAPAPRQTGGLHSFAEIRYHARNQYRTETVEVDERDVTRLNLGSGAYSVRFFDREEITDEEGNPALGEPTNLSPEFIFGTVVTAELQRNRQWPEEAKGYQFKRLSLGNTLPPSVDRAFLQRVQGKPFAVTCTGDFVDVTNVVVVDEDGEQKWPPKEPERSFSVRPFRHINPGWNMLDRE